MTRVMQLLMLFAAALLGSRALAADVTVQAAASLTNAFRDLAPLFDAAHPGTKLQLNFGASGALLQQIARGAPADVFASADQETMDQAQSRQLIDSALRRDFVGNTLVVITPAATTAAPPKTLADLDRPAVTRIAIGLPASVPVGRYTQAALEAAGLWKAIEPKMIGANNVRQTLDYVARVEVDAGFVYATDAALMPDKVRVAFTVPTSKPIRYPVAVLAGAPNGVGARQFVAFLYTPAAQAVLMKYGFSPL
jgi:molybdate transport system substrate-binding protein